LISLLLLALKDEFDQSLSVITSSYGMSSFFDNTRSFTAWLGAKSESDLKHKLFRIDTKLRLNGSKQDLVRRIVEATRNMSMDRQKIIFPELARQNPRPEVVRVRRSRLAVGAHVNEIEPRASSSGPLRRAGSSRMARDLRPLPVFDDSSLRPSHAHQVPVLVQPEVEIARTPVRRVNLAAMVQRFETGNFPALGNSDPRTPEQILQETLEVQAGLLIQTIAHALTPRPRRLNSVAGSNADVSALGALPNTRPASVLSAEKVGPEVSVGNDVGSKLECKVCLDKSVDTVLLPCGHACCCYGCSVKIKFSTWDAKCPICRSRIQTVSMLYFS